MGLLDPLRSLVQRAMEPMGADEDHPMWSEDPLAPDGPNPDPDERRRRHRSSGPLGGLTSSDGGIPMFLHSAGDGGGGHQGSGGSGGSDCS